MGNLIKRIAAVCLVWATLLLFLPTHAAADEVAEDVSSSVVEEEGGATEGDTTEDGTAESGAGEDSTEAGGTQENSTSQSGAEEADTSTEDAGGGAATAESNLPLAELLIDLDTGLVGAGDFLKLVSTCPLWWQAARQP